MVVASPQSMKGVKDMEKTKKEFQKVIKAIRYEMDDDISRRQEYPKLMMTAVQMKKNQATVNCGGEWGSRVSTKAVAEIVMNDEDFKAFLTKHNAEANLELNNFGTYQIRVHF